MHYDEGEASATVVATCGAGFERLLETVGIPVVAQSEAECFRLVAVGGELELRPPGEFERPGIRPRFPPDPPSRAAQSHPLVRAFGRRGQTIFDLTAGLGGDAYRLAAGGHRVRAFEREPALAAMLIANWESSRRGGNISPEVADRLEFNHADAREVLQGMAHEEISAYIDPMYPPPRRASALPRRELQVLRRLLGKDESAADLLALARTCAGRVVVKRPPHAAPLAADASFVVESKLVRFDVYLDPRRMGAPKA